jgi:hypothetical protein
VDAGAVHRPQVAGALLELAAGVFAVLDFDSDVDEELDGDPDVDSDFESDFESDLAAAGLSVAVELDRLSVL